MSETKLLQAILVNVHDETWVPSYWEKCSPLQEQLTSPWCACQSIGSALITVAFHGDTVLEG